jgi:hypothetical protein
MNNNKPVVSNRAAGNNKSIQQKLQMQRQRRQQQMQRKPAASGLSARNKIAIQKARKNVQKAKRLLATRKGPIQQVMVVIYFLFLCRKKSTLDHKCNFGLYKMLIYLFDNDIFF